MSNILIQEFHTHLGVLIIGVYNNSCCLCDWKYRKQRAAIDQRITQFLDASFIEKPHKLHNKICAQLHAYFSGTLSDFTIPLLYCGSSFQTSVWEALRMIPYGSVISYSSLSRKLNNPNATRAVAAANGANALSIIVPCHRVVGSDGTLTGYAGGLLAKEKLLQLEGALWSGQQRLF